MHPPSLRNCQVSNRIGSGPWWLSRTLLHCSTKQYCRYSTHPHGIIYLTESCMANNQSKFDRPIRSDPQDPIPGSDLGSYDLLVYVAFSEAVKCGGSSWDLLSRGLAVLCSLNLPQWHNPMHWSPPSSVSCSVLQCRSSRGRELVAEDNYRLLSYYCYMFQVNGIRDDTKILRKFVNGVCRVNILNL